MSRKRTESKPDHSVGNNRVSPEVATPVRVRKYTWPLLIIRSEEQPESVEVVPPYGFKFYFDYLERKRCGVAPREEARIVEMTKLDASGAMCLSAEDLRILVDAIWLGETTEPQQSHSDLERTVNIRHERQLKKQLVLLLSELTTPAVVDVYKTIVQCQEKMSSQELKETALLLVAMKLYLESPLEPSWMSNTIQDHLCRPHLPLSIHELLLEVIKTARDQQLESTELVTQLEKLYRAVSILYQLKTQ